MRPHPDTRVREWLKERDYVYLSVITIDEITFGLHARGMLHRLRWFESFIKDRCFVLNIDERITHLSGKLRGELRQKGQVPEQADMLIAATAQAHSLSLATRNTKDFKGTGRLLYSILSQCKYSND